MHRKGHPKEKKDQHSCRFHLRYIDVQILSGEASIGRSVEDSRIESSCDKQMIQSSSAWRILRYAQCVYTEKVIVTSVGDCYFARDWRKWIIDVTCSRKSVVTATCLWDTDIHHPVVCRYWSVLAKLQLLTHEHMKDCRVEWTFTWTLTFAQVNGSNDGSSSTLWRCLYQKL